MKLKEIYNSKKPVISYEIFPPKGEGAELKVKIETLFQELNTLLKYNPSFISVTYGAGGSTRERTLELVLKVKNELNIQPLLHFTCVGTEKEQTHQYIKEVQDAGIENILALRGDPPKGETKFVKPENGFGYANELVEFISFHTDLGIAVAGYPEGHQECASFEQDIINLKKKVDAGADVIITQLFYDNAFFFNYLEKAHKAKIDVPIIPGIMIITNVSQVERMTTMCGCTIPDKIMSKLKEYQDDNKAVSEIGIEYAINQCKELLASDVPGLHFCTLNKASATDRVLKELDIK
ncbi:MAG: methylenetetrahydrofolate reductase [NAD(P)H] [Candidatus Melainabacteria bacterium RIFOXYA12_FULL_32_12]|nr:MAG: methylenetetrahydrofolate reductase [NAD(P)H] [Candidatus Melainabacteria bacterium RIFOXYA12_FULL_32_12]